MLSESLKSRVSDPYVVRRAGYMLLFIILFGAAVEGLLAAVILVQFIHLLLTGKRNRPLLWLGRLLSEYTYGVLRYLTFASEDKPFPFGEWPTVPESSSTSPVPQDTPPGERQ